MLPVVILVVDIFSTTAFLILGDPSMLLACMSVVDLNLGLCAVNWDVILVNKFENELSKTFAVKFVILRVVANAGAMFEDIVVSLGCITVVI